MLSAPFDDVSPARRAFDRTAQRVAGNVTRELLRHWLAWAVVLDVLWIFVALLDPLLAAWGIDSVALPIWNFYHNFCVQQHLYYLAGYPIALCQRNLAVFGSMLTGMLLFAAARRWLRPLSLWGYAVLAAPMAIDGFTQLFGWRESTVELRTFTGVLFGLGSIWYLFPSLDAAARRWLDAVDGDAVDDLSDDARSPQRAITTAIPQ